METPEFVQISLERFLEFTKQKEECDAAIQVANMTANIYSKVIIDLLMNIQLPFGVSDLDKSSMKFARQVIEAYNNNPKGLYTITYRDGDRHNQNGFTISEKRKS